MPFVQRPDDHLQHIIGAQQHVVIPEPQHLETAPFQGACSTDVKRLLLAMLGPIEFHDEMVLNATEVRAIPGHRMLAVERGAELSGAHARPERGFGHGLVPSQFLGAIRRCVPIKRPPALASHPPCSASNASN
jgi:hypothetical protein